MAEFEVLGRAPHVGRDSNGLPKLYKPGSTVESDEDLDVKFANKFRRKGAPTKAPAMLNVPPEARTVMDDPNIDVLKMKRNQMLAKAEKAGRKIKDDTMKKIKEERHKASERLNRSAGTNEAETEYEEEDMEEQEEQDFGEDVTDQFPSAQEKNLKVFKEGKNFNVVSENKKVNESALKSKAKTNEFIDSVEFEETEEEEQQEETEEEE